MKYLPLVWAGLFRKTTRTVLTLLTIAIAFTLFGLLQAVEMAFTSSADALDAKRLLTTARYSIIEPLPIAYLSRIEQVPGVAAVAYGDWFGARYQNLSNAFPVFAVDPSRYLDMYPEFAIAPEQRAAFITARTGAVAGRRLVDRFGWTLGQKLPISSEIHPRTDGSMHWEFDLVGILDAEDPMVRGNADVVWINVAGFDDARQTGKGTVAWYVVRITDPRQARSVSAAIDTQFMNSADETTTQPEKEFAIAFARQMGDIGALVTRILIAVFVTILLATGNTMEQSIRERVPELAIMKTMGFSDGRITALVLGEAAALLFLGAGVGMGLATALLAVTRAASGPLPPLFVAGATWALAAAIALAVALAAALPAALRARGLKIVDALGGHR
jgi:putative ABC transport system permease protein